MALNLSQKFPVKTSAPAAASKPSSSTFEAVLLLIVIVLFSWFMIQPKRAELASESATYSQLQKDQSSQKKNKEDLQQALQDFSKHKDDVVKLDEALPLDPRTPKIYILLNYYVTRSGLELSELLVSGNGDKVMAGNTDLIENPYSAQRKLNKVEVSLSATGKFDQFLAFLQYLETSGRIVDVTNVDIGASKDDQLDFKVQLTTYYYE